MSDVDNIASNSREKWYDEMSGDGWFGAIGNVAKRAKIGNFNAMGVANSDKEYASKTLANIKRAQWMDYKARFPAIHKEYLDMSMNPDFTLEQVDRVNDNVERSYGRAQASKVATLDRMGVQDTATDDGLDKALSVAHGKNSVRQHGEARRLNAIGGGQIPTLQTQGG